MVVFNPHHTFIHRHTRVWIVSRVELTSGRGTEKGTRWSGPGKLTYYASPDTMSHEILVGQSN